MMPDPLSTLPPEEAPEVPGIRSWGGVYTAVLGAFVLMVVLLSLLPIVFS
ncbi:MAG: hypothetical protein JNN01_20580 [Opitutaceae bacterium]|nr:hypothetical protein [Opitutaceae bacterium]